MKDNEFRARNVLEIDVEEFNRRNLRRSRKGNGKFN